MKICVTGANGFIGSYLCPALQKTGHKVLAYDRAEFGDITERKDWSLLQDCDAIIHLAGRAHQSGRYADDEAAFMRDNAEATQCLLDAATMHGVGRFVYISTIAIFGSISCQGPFTTQTLPNPDNAYARSKLEAEKHVRASSLNTTIIRIPLVYGEGVRANFHTLLRGVAQRFPIPLGLVCNARSIVYIGNVVDALLHIVGTKASYNQVVHIADAAPLSSKALAVGIAEALQVKPRLWYVPPRLLWLVATCIRREMHYYKLCGDLTLETTASNALLNWTPPISTEEGLRRTVDWFKQQI